MLALIALAGLAGHQWTLVCGGDIMLNGLKPDPSRLAPAISLIKGATVSLANLEVPITDAKRHTDGKSDKDVKAKTQFVLKANPRHLPVLKQWGFTVLTQGNNHAMDYRWTGLSQMLKLLDDNSIRHTGAGKDRDEAWLPARCDVSEDCTLSIGAALAFAGEKNAQKCSPAGEDHPGVATLYLDGDIHRKRLKALIKRLRKDKGPVILFLHWGTERATVPRAYQIALGRACIDAGADAVIGAHPHVLQGGELYRGKPILYSLGNLISPMPCDVALAELKFDGRKFLGMNLHPFWCSKGTLTEYEPDELQDRLVDFRDLSQDIQDQFPSEHSKVLPLGDSRTSSQALMAPVTFSGASSRVRP